MRCKFAMQLKLHCVVCIVIGSTFTYLNIDATYGGYYLHDISLCQGNRISKHILVRTFISFHLFRDYQLAQKNIQVSLFPFTKRKKNKQHQALMLKKMNIEMSMYRLLMFRSSYGLLYTSFFFSIQNASFSLNPLFTNDILVQLVQFYFSVLFCEIAVSPVGCHSAFYLFTTQLSRTFLVFDMYFKL